MDIEWKETAEQKTKTLEEYGVELREKVEVIIKDLNGKYKLTQNMQDIVQMLMTE